MSEQKNLGQKIVDKEVHYFVSSFSHWVVDADLLKAINKHKREAGERGCGGNVFIVPLPIEADYKIDHYIPQVEGVQLIAYVEYAKKKKSKK